ncbi:exported protein of unknown function [Hyphomicrobium sp. MC1]|nr:exported protein of unknown function [Hyphomicrobium sp. MC1]
MMRSIRADSRSIVLSVGAGILFTAILQTGGWQMSHALLVASSASVSLSGHVSSVREPVTWHS